MWDYLYKNLVAENIFLQSVANIMTPIAGEETNKKNGLLKFLNGTAYVDLFSSFDKQIVSTSNKQTAIYENNY